MFTSPVGVDESKPLPEFFDILTKYSNIHFRNMNLWRFSQGTPIFEWLKTDQLFESPYVFEHMSDILRAVTLHKFGGFYLDLDVVVQKDMDNLGEDFIPNDWSDVINGAVMHLNNYGIGKEVAEKYLR